MLLWALASAFLVLDGATATTFSSPADGGAFGHWLDEDAAGMPAFDYTLDQTSPAGAKIARAYHDLERQADWRNATDNLFMFGNDRLVVVASTFGYVQVRQDERGPKFLQDVDPSSNQFGGGIVYVVDGTTRELLASSWFSGQPHVRRRYGIGYMSVVQNSSSMDSYQADFAACKLSRALGCYKDADCRSCSSGPILPVHQPQLHDKVTQSACASVCHDQNFSVAGIDGGNHCYCGNASDLASAEAKSRIRPAAECQVSTCHADPSQKCGGDGRLLAYSFNCTGQPPLPPPSPAPSPSGSGISLHHELFAPFGDDPVLLSSVMLSAESSRAVRASPRNVSVITVFGTQMYQLQQCDGTGGPCTSAQRRAFQVSNYQKAIRQFYGPHDSDHMVLATTAVSNMSKAQPTHWDATPPDTFLAAVKSTASDSVSFGCDASSFYGAGGAPAPSLEVVCDPSTSDGGAMIIERSISLPAGNSVSLHSVYGYAPTGFFVDKLIEKYATEASVTAARAELGPAWRNETIGFNLTNLPAVAREVRWNSGYVRQALTHYDFFGGESVLDQGSQYRYGSGFEGAARDPLQHLLPLIYSAPERAASVLRMQLQTMVPPAAWGPPKPSGPFHPADDAWNTAYALYGSGIVDDINFGVFLNGASDLEIYLLLASSEYLLATKDINFLTQRIPYRYKVNQSATSSRSALEAILDAYRYLVNHTSTGQHGLMRVQTGDWNDGFSGLAGCGAKDTACQTAVQKQAESIANSAMMTYVLERFAQALELCRIDKSVVGEARAFAAAQRAAVREYGWNGQWINRAWLPHQGFVGSNAKGDKLGITMEPQPWVLLSGMLNASEQNILLNSLERLSCPLSWKQSMMGHMWVALNHPVTIQYDRRCTVAPLFPDERCQLQMVMGVATVNKSLAWEKWTQTSLANEARLHPTLWPGVWTAADYISIGTGRSGGGAFPAFNTHRHAWPLYSLATSLVGIVFTQHGATIRPGGLPQVGAFAFTSRLVNVSRRGDGVFAGTLLPLRETAACVVTIELPYDEMTEDDLHSARLRTARARLAGGQWLHAKAVDDVDRRGRKVLCVILSIGVCGGEAGALEWQF